VTRSDPASRVPGKVLAKKDEIPPVGFIDVATLVTMRWPATGPIAFEEIGQTLGQFLLHLQKRQKIAASRRTFHL
jgi:hypothetical protein